MSALFAIVHLCKMVYEAWPTELCDSIQKWLDTFRHRKVQTKAKTFLTGAPPKMGQSLMEGQSSIYCCDMLSFTLVNKEYHSQKRYINVNLTYHAIHIFSLMDVSSCTGCLKKIVRRFIKY